jgi:hypothetical protein
MNASLPRVRLHPARARRLAERIHALGPRSLYHLFLDLSRGDNLRDTLEHYGSLPAKLAEPWRDLPPPVRVVDGETAP